MYWTALFMGLAGGLHCVGMCGPLVLAVTAKNPFMGGKIIYNLGRVSMYGFLGLIVTVFGVFIDITQYQNIFAYLVGGILLLLGFGAINGIKMPLLTPMIHRFNSFLKSRFGALLQAKRNIFFLGMLNGMLPCGLTYLALAYCLTLGNALDGLVFMIIFGFGTIPVMAGLLWLMGITLNKVKLSYRKVSMVVMIAMGSLIIGRAFFSHTHQLANNQNEVVDNEVICR